MSVAKYARKYANAIKSVRRMRRKKDNGSDIMKYFDRLADYYGVPKTLINLK